MIQHIGSEQTADILIKFQNIYNFGILLKYLLFVQNQYAKSWDFYRSFWFIFIVEISIFDRLSIWPNARVNTCL